MERVKVIIIGGGNGPSFLRKGLKEYSNVEIVSIAPPADSGRSTGKLRNDYPTIAWGDLTNAMADQAINPIDELFFRTRFEYGHLNPHRVSNIVSVALAEMFKQYNPQCNHFLEAIKFLTEKFPIYGKVFPISTDIDIHMISEKKNGDKLSKEHEADEELVGGPIVRIELSKDAKILPEVDAEIRSADIIVFATSSIHGSIETQLKVEGVPQAINESPAIKVMYSNIANVEGQTDGFSTSDYAEIVCRYLRGKLDHFIYYRSPESPLDPVVVDLYKRAGQNLIEMDDRINIYAKRVHQLDLVKVQQEEGKLVFRHNPKLGAAELMNIWEEYAA